MSEDRLAVRSLFREYEVAFVESVEPMLAVSACPEPWADVLTALRARAA